MANCKKKPKRVVNAMDHLDMPMLPLPSEGTLLPEFSTDRLDGIITAESGSRIGGDIYCLGQSMDLWPEIKKHLTAREFQVFEFTYRYQMPYHDIVKIMHITASSVYKLLAKAEAKLQKTFEKQGQK